MAAETTHEGVSLEGTKAASLAPAFDIDWYDKSEKVGHEGAWLVFSSHH